MLERTLIWERLAGNSRMSGGIFEEEIENEETKGRK